MPMGYMYFDPLFMVISLIAAGLSLFAQMKVKSAFSKYSRVGNSRNLSGAEAARMMLDAEGLRDVSIGRANGWLSDHYNPASKVINLSPDVYDGRSVAAVGVACHEAGHALQHATGYSLLKLRNLLVPTVGIGSQFGMLLVFIGIAVQITQLTTIGLILFSTVALFQLITLPVELDASSRSKRALVSHGIVAQGAEERGVSSVLNAAALTYLAALIGALLQLFFLLLRSGVLGGRRSRD